jgi:hypothetical protein
MRYMELRGIINRMIFTFLLCLKARAKRLESVFLMLPYWIGHKHYAANKIHKLFHIVETGSWLKLIMRYIHVEK